MDAHAAQERTTEPGGDWAAKAEPKGTPAEISAWRAAVERCEAASTEHGWSKADIAKRAHIPVPTFVQWVDGSYGARIAAQTARVVKWLDGYDEGRELTARIRPAPAWIETPTARKVWNVLVYAQLMPEMAFATLGAGMGKTTTARHYVATRPNATLVTMSPLCATPAAAMNQLAIALDVTDRNNALRDRAIGEKLKRNGRQTLLIVDEAQNLHDAAIDQLRQLYDVYECGLCLLGNNELYRRFGGSPREGYGQLHGRFGTRVLELNPTAQDIDLLITGWGIEDPEARALLTIIGGKVGGLRQIGKTVQRAGMEAAGEDAPIDAGHIRRAWASRAGEAH